MEQQEILSQESSPAKRREVPLASNPQRQQKFLEALALYGVPSYASKIASPHATGSCLRTFSDLRDRDPAFAANWREAEQTAHDRILTAAMDRGVFGIDDVIVQGGNVVKDDDGNPIIKKLYSDKILDRLLQRFPQFSTKRVEHSGTVNHSDGRLFISETDIYALSPAQRRNLVEILNSIAESRGEAMAIDRVHAVDAVVIEPEHEPDPWELEQAS